MGIGQFCLYIITDNNMFVIPAPKQFEIDVDSLVALISEV